MDANDLLLRPEKDRSSCIPRKTPVPFVAGTALEVLRCPPEGAKALSCSEASLVLGCNNEVST